MKPYYGAINSDNQWTTSVDDIFRQWEKLKMHDDSNCHVDGVFDCRRMHYIPDNYDYLCDGCVSALLVHPSPPPNVTTGMKEWRSKLRNNPDVIERYTEREGLINNC